MLIKTSASLIKLPFSTNNSHWNDFVSVPLVLIIHILYWSDMFHDEISVQIVVINRLRYLSMQ